MIFKEREVVEVWCTVHHSAPNFDNLSLKEILIDLVAYIKMESVEKVVSKSECPKLFQLGLNYHIVRIFPI